MNLYGLQHSKEAFLTAGDIADILRVDPQSIRNQARVDASALGFPVTRIGSQLKIPRIPFLRYIGLEDTHHDV